MEDLALHILDIAENSLSAGATVISIAIVEDPVADRLELEIADNGRGMEPEDAVRALDPFITSRTTRRVGLGLSFLEQGARAANGGVEIHSRPGEGTRVVATFQLSHIDRQPLGDVPSAIVTLMAGHEDLDLRFTHRLGERSISVTTGDLRACAGAGRGTAGALRRWRDFLKSREQELTTTA